MKTACIGLVALFAASAIAQTPPPASPPPATPNPTNPTAMPQQQPRNTPPHAGTSGQQTMQPTDTRSGDVRSGMSMPFDTLDTKHAGYLTKNELKSDGWLAQHFGQCDSDHNLRVTRDEYATCTRPPGR
jgi:hypothetical protein